MCWRSTRGHAIPITRWCAWTRPQAVPCRDAPADPDEAGTPGPLRLRVPAHGTANIFMMFAPLEGWRHVKVTDRHTAVDYAHVLKSWPIATSPTPRPSYWSRTISTIHGKGSLYEAFQPPRPGDWSSASNGTTLQSMAVGLISRSPNSASIVPVPRPPDSRQTNPRRGNRRLGARPQCQPHQGQLALHNPRCTYQTQAPLPCNLTESGD